MALEAICYKIGLSLVGITRGFFKIFSYSCYQFVNMSIIVLISSLNIWFLTLGGIIYLLLANFINFNDNLKKNN